MGFVTARDGARLFHKSWGIGPPIVLSHGWPLDADSWEAQMLFLAVQRLPLHRARPPGPRALYPDRGTATR